MFVAVPVVAALAWWLVPLSPYGIDGWRWVVLIGAAASMVIWSLRLSCRKARSGSRARAGPRKPVKILGTLEGSAGATSPRPRKSAARRQRARDAKVGFADLFKPPYLSLVVLFMVFNFCQAFGFYGFANWVPRCWSRRASRLPKACNIPSSSPCLSDCAAVGRELCRPLRAQMDHLRRMRGDHRVRDRVLAIDAAGAADPVRRAAHGGQHDDVLRLSRLSDRGVPDRDPRAGLGAWSIR